MQQQPQKTGLSSLISGLSQSNEQKSSSIFGNILSSQNNTKEKQQNLLINAENNKGYNDDEEEQKSSGNSKNQSILFKAITKQSKEPLNKNSSGSSQEQNNNKPQQYVDRITGAGVLLWEKFKLSEDEYKQKQEILQEKSPQREGFTILLFGQKEKKGKFKDQILYTDPGGKIDNNENSQTIASRELFEESCGTFLIGEQHFDNKKSFRMGGSYILYNILLQAIEEDIVNLKSFNTNYETLSKIQNTPTFWLESMLITRIFASELISADLFGSQNILTIKDAYGNNISIGRRCIAILRALVKSPNVFNFQTNELLINKPVLMKGQLNNIQNLLEQYPWLNNTTIYQSINSI